MRRPHVPCLLLLAIGLLVSANGCEEDSPGGGGDPLACGVDDGVVELSGPWSHDGAVVPGSPTPPTAPYFREVPREDSGLLDVLADGRVMVVDLDGDGWDDLVTIPVSSEPLVPTVARNLGGAGTPFRFADFTEASGLEGAPMALGVFGDVDDDGDQDLFAGQSGRSRGEPGIWLNDGGGRFTPVADPGLASTTIEPGAVYEEQAGGTFGDFDGDGHLDLYVGHWRVGALDGAGNLQTARAYGEPDQLYLGDGEGGFVRQTLPSQTNPMTVAQDPALEGTARPTYGVCAGDFDGDGDLDVFANNYGPGRPALGSPPRYWEHNLLWRNDSAGPGAATFVDVGTEAGVDATLRGIGGVQDETGNPVVMGGTTFPPPIGGNGFGCQFADFDNDGDLDLIIGTIAHPDYPQSDRTMLHVNQGDGTFTEESAQRGLQYAEDELHPVLVDVDQDGRLDLAMSRLRGGTKWELYLQAAGGTFDMQTYARSGVDIERPSATVWTDLDHDGDLDFFMSKGNGGRLFENLVGQANGHLTLELVARCPRDATGARVTATTSAGTQSREVTSGGGHYNNQHGRRVVFGLGGDSGARDVTIRWPGGSVTRLGDVTAGYTLRVVQGGDVEVLAAP